MNILLSLALLSATYLSNLRADDQIVVIGTSLHEALLESTKGLEGETSELAEVAVKIHKDMLDKANSFIENGKDADNFSDLGDALFDMSLLMPYTNASKSSLFKMADGVNLFAHYAAVAKTNLFPPNAYSMICKKHVSYIEVTLADEFKDTIAKAAELHKKVNLEKFSPEAKLPEAAQKVLFQSILTTMAELGVYLHEARGNVEMIKAVATKAGVEFLHVQQFVAYTDVFLSTIADTVSKEEPLQKVLHGFCTNVGYTKFTSILLEDVNKHGIKYWESVKPLSEGEETQISTRFLPLLPAMAGVSLIAMVIFGAATLS